jgi:acyl-CoA reductase-like NAD-dependent aldehyde dehydrogenase
MEFLGEVPAMSAEEVETAVEKARIAAASWKRSSFDQRRLLLRVLLKYIVENQEAICKISATDSGKPMVDAAFGELIVTCEKIRWLLSEGGRWLKPEKRSSGVMVRFGSDMIPFD